MSGAHDPRAISNAPYLIVISAASSYVTSRRHDFAADFPNPGDGLCAIDVYHAPETVHDSASNHDISVAAKSVLDKCVLIEIKKGGSVPSGGVVRGVG